MGLRISFLVCLTVLCAVPPLAAQSVTPLAGGDEAPPDARACDKTAPAASEDSAAAQERIVARPMRPGAGKRIARVPLYPLIGLGRGFEKGLLLIEENNIEQRIGYWRDWMAARHVETLTGGMGPGTGFGFGVRLFADEFFSPRVRLEAPLRYSTNRYQQYESTIGFSLAGNRALFLDLTGRFRSRPQEDFFGIGRDSDQADRTSYFLQDRGAGASLGSELGATRIEFGFRFTRAEIFRGRDKGFPSTEVVFPGLPGLANGSSLLSYGVRASTALLDNPADPHRGVRWAGRFLRNDSTDGGGFRFFDYGAEMEGYVPLGAGRTLALRGVGDFREPRGGGEIPFYLLPHLGGGQTMRGFREFRFHDRAALLFNAEYRYAIWKYMDFVAFLDQGQVAPRPGAFTWRGFRTGYGGGLRVKGSKGSALRFDVGRSSEGTRFYFVFSPEF